MQGSESFPCKSNSSTRQEWALGFQKGACNLPEAANTTVSAPALCQ